MRVVKIMLTLTLDYRTLYVARLARLRRKCDDPCSVLCIAFDRAFESCGAGPRNYPAAARAGLRRPGPRRLQLRIARDRGRRGEAAGHQPERCQGLCRLRSGPVCRRVWTD